MRTSAFQGSILVLDLIVPATQVARWQATLVLVEEKCVVTRKTGVIRADCAIGYTAPYAKLIGEEGDNNKFYGKS